MAYLERVPEACPATKFIEFAAKPQAGAPHLPEERGTGVACLYFR